MEVEDPGVEAVTGAEAVVAVEAEDMVEGAEVTVPGSLCQPVNS